MTSESTFDKLFPHLIVVICIRKIFRHMIPFQ